VHGKGDDAKSKRGRARVAYGFFLRVALSSGPCLPRQTKSLSSSGHEATDCTDGVSMNADTGMVFASERADKLAWIFRAREAYRVAELRPSVVGSRGKQPQMRK
jgi:hypothetical protein